MKLQVLNSGPLTTVQDRGRFGYMAYGIGPSGAMDQTAYETANRLVGNRNGEAVLESTLMGPTIRFEGDCIIALTGADMGAQLNGTPLETYVAYSVLANQTLTMGVAKTGCRGYLAVSGGIDVPVVMGSRSTNLKCQLGGVEGRALKRGDVLETAAAGKAARKKAAKKPELSQSVTVRVIPGPQDDLFTQRGLDTLWGSAYTVSTSSDRMGLRLEGPAVETISGSDIVSDGIALGSIQVTSAGQPIILMADRQTTGGYAKVGTVCSADLPKLAQLKPGGEIRLKPVSVQEAQRLLRKQRWLTWLHRI
ncbi:MAG: biotin-dependent carboxyltransferase [Ruminococcaceae bacterium]|nr:biotin-dependent carboxyltransferase [Oscillospiraceae bacterium]